MYPSSDRLLDNIVIVRLYRPFFTLLPTVIQLALYALFILIELWVLYRRRQARLSLHSEMDHDKENNDTNPVLQPQV
jgi:hypothetical protein